MALNKTVKTADCSLENYIVLTALTAYPKKAILNIDEAIIVQGGTSIICLLLLYCTSTT